MLTVPDNSLSWAAYLVAKRSNLPFITNFQDWWPRGQFYSITEKPYRIVQDLLERRLRTMYRASDLAFCTSEGMKRFLGSHPLAPVLLPCPSRRDGTTPNLTPPPGGRPLRVVYAGTIVAEYGARVLAIAKALRDSRHFHFEAYGPEPDWPAEDKHWAKTCGVYRGFLPHAELKPRLQEADAFLVVMRLGTAVAIDDGDEFYDQVS